MPREHISLSSVVRETLLSLHSGIITLLLFGHSRREFRVLTLLSDNGVQVFENRDGLQLYAIDPDVSAGSICVVGRQLCLLRANFHAI